MEEQFTTLDFGGRARRLGGMFKNEVSLSSNKRTHCLTFNITVSREIVRKGFTHAEVVRNNCTGEHLIVFNKERKGIKLTLASCCRSSNVRLNNKMMVAYLRKVFNIPPDEERTILNISGNLAKRDDIMAFKLTLNA